VCEKSAVLLVVLCDIGGRSMSAPKSLYPKIALRGLMLYNFQPGLGADECHTEMRATVGDEAPSSATVFRWYSRFQTGHLDLADDPHEGRPKTATDDQNVAAVEALLNEDPNVTYQTIEETLGLDARSINRIMHDHLGLSKKSARWVPRDLSEEEKVRRVEFARQFLKDFDEGRSSKFNMLVTGDETWVHFYDPQLKSQSSQWSSVGARPPTKFRRQSSAGKVMVAVFFSKRKIVAPVELEEGCTVTSQWYSEKCLPKVFAQLSSPRGKDNLRRWFLHHDNAPAHKAARTMDALAAVGINLVEPAPYSPDLAPCDFFLFPKIKKNLRGIRFETRAAVLEALQVELEKLEKHDFEVCFDAWIYRMKKCIDVGGNYVEI
jgi:[histone H3]-lysine36 N-dimethyltransferase SETMAR